MKIEKLPCLRLPRCGAPIAPQLVLPSLYLFPAAPYSYRLSSLSLPATPRRSLLHSISSRQQCARSPLAWLCTLQHPARLFPAPCSLLPIPSPVFVFPLSPSSPLLSSLLPQSPPVPLSAVKASALEKGPFQFYFKSSNSIPGLESVKLLTSSAKVGETAKVIETFSAWSFQIFLFHRLEPSTVIVFLL